MENTMENLGTFVWFGSNDGNTGLSLFTAEECDEKRFDVTNVASYLDRIYEYDKHTFADKTIASIYLPEVELNSIEIMLLKELAISQNILFRARDVSSCEQLEHYKKFPIWK
ncbi:hypothetical protein [Alteromonas gracilis]|uniref:hypothetical protein n=1 Tax=Alteromonas gracilis TaxID=1479524 RepID=UPI003734DACE